MCPVKSSRRQARAFGKISLCRLHQLMVVGMPSIVARERRMWIVAPMMRLAVRRIEREFMVFGWLDVWFLQVWCGDLEICK